MAVAFLSLLVLIGFFWYYGSPGYTDVGYRPVQPIPFNHKLHAGDLGMDCRYCHFQVEISFFANVPSTQTCMNCHRIIGTENVRLLPVRESMSSKIPIQWVRVHKLPDYAYFNHSAHLRAGVNCKHCHGNVSEADVVMQVEPLSMGWCLDCHRNPDPYLGPPNQVTNMSWTPPSDQLEFAARFRKANNINPPTDCSGCHR